MKLQTDNSVPLRFQAEHKEVLFRDLNALFISKLWLALDACEFFRTRKQIPYILPSRYSYKKKSTNKNMGNLESLSFAFSKTLRVSLQSMEGFILHYII